MQNRFDQSSGYLELILGPMGGGKSSYLKAQLTKCADIGMKALYICHSNDAARDSTEGLKSDGFMTSHDSSFHGLSSKIDKKRVKLLSKLDVKDYHVIGVDESQFFDIMHPEGSNEFIADLLKTVTSWVEDLNKRVLVSSLPGDFRRKKFGYAIDLIPMVDNIVWCPACCPKCGDELDALGFHGNKINCPAPFTARLVASESQKLVGTMESYAPMCRSHIKKHNAEMGFDNKANDNSDSDISDIDITFSPSNNINMIVGATCEVD
jgi:thymidine kinase